MAIHSDNKRLSFKELVASLRELVQTRKTGTVYLLTDSKHYVRIGLKRGRIAQLVFGKYRGEDAIEHIRQIRSATWSFAEDVVSGTGELPLPSTSTLMQWLEDAVYAQQGLGSAAHMPPPASPAPLELPARETPGDDEGDEVPEALRGVLGPEEAPSLEPEPEPSASQSGPPLTQSGHALYEAVNRELALYLGPIAPMVTTDYRNDLVTAVTLDGLDRILVEIAEEIDDPAQAERFRQRIIQLATT